MTETCSTVACDECHWPLMRIDFYGERLEGCLFFNPWAVAGGVRLCRKLPEADVEALRGLRAAWSLIVSPPMKLAACCPRCCPSRRAATYKCGARARLLLPWSWNN